MTPTRPDPMARPTHHLAGDARDAPTIRPLTGTGVEAVANELAALYGAAYAGPPWSEGPDDVERYRARLAAWAHLEGFTGLLARHDDGGLAGAAYGWVGPPAVDGSRLPGFPTGVASVFHVGDLMVHPAAWRRGLGRRLLDQLVAERGRCVLLTHPDSDAWRLYEAAGWRRTGRAHLAGAPTLLVYARG